MKKKDLINLTKEELLEKLEEAEWCDKELLREYDERCHDGRIKFKPIPMDNLENYIHEKYSKRREKKAS